MEYKVKVKPEDFYVREIASIPIEEKGEFGVFKLKKIGWNTIDLLRRISKTYSIPISKISYGGKKDRHALTEQFITIKNPPKGLNIKEKNYSLKLIGFSREPMSPFYIEGNFFSITIRSISKEAEPYLNDPLESIRNFGFINYFDDQRFGSYDTKLGFIGEKVVKEHFNGALKIYFTHIHPEDKKEAKERKRKILENWGSWNECLRLAKTELEKFAFSHLTEKPKDFLTVVRKIPKEELSMFFSAFQSFLWNETVRRLIFEILPLNSLVHHKGIVGNYVFFDRIDPMNWQYLRNLTIPTVSSKIKMNDKRVERILNDLLNERGLKPSMFNLRKVRQAFFSSVERDVLTVPQSFEYRVDDDEIYSGKRKLTLQFILPRGSYATMLIKRIFAKKLKEGGDKNALFCGS